MIDVSNTLYAKGNPYQRLIYSGSRYRCVPVRASELIESLVDTGDTNNNYLHLHWDDRIFGRGENTRENHILAAEMLRGLDEFRRRGGKILWTIHNARPHLVTDLEAFQAARSTLCNIVSHIHVHTVHARNHMAEQYGVADSRMTIVPHPSYLGAYEPAKDTLSRTIPNSDVRRFLMFGLMRSSKGLDSVYEAVKILDRKGSRYQLEIRGKAFKSSLRMFRFLNRNENVTAVPERVADNEVAATFARAHVYLAPFTDLFTSGSIMLAQTFGLPIIGPDLPALRQCVPKSSHRLLYSVNANRGFYRKIQEVIEMDDRELNELRQECFAFARERSPESISEQLAGVLDQI